MANILFRVSSTAPIPASTTVKNAPLTNIEVDGNFRSVNEDLANIVNVLLPLKANLDSPVFTGTVTATDFNSTSDAALKENVENLYHAAIDEIRPVEFTWKETGEKSYGVIAQELENVFPELVKTGEDGIKSVSYIPLIAMLIAKVQYLETEIKNLK